MWQAYQSKDNGVKMELQNKYVLINNCYLHLGTVEHDPDHAAVIVEIKDWFGEKTFKQSRTFNGVHTALLGYMAQTHAVEVTEEDFFSKLVLHLMEQAKINAHEFGSFDLTFKGTAERRALLNFYMDSLRSKKFVIL